jgi:hypothetical protein
MSRRYMHSCAHFSILHKKPRYTINLSIHNNGLKKMWYIYTMGYYRILKKKKKEILSFGKTLVNLEDITLNAQRLKAWLK